MLLGRRTFVLSFPIVAILGGWSTYRASRVVPEFYEDALQISAQVADKAGDEFAAQTFALASRARREGDWQAVFTDEQVNGWLTADMPQKHPELLVEGYDEPRIRFVEGGVQIGCRFRKSGIDSIVWLDVSAALTDTQEIALRFRRVRAGLLPLPLAQVLEALTQAATNFDLPIRWTTTDGDPTAIVGLPPLDRGGWRYELDGLQVGKGQLALSGHTTNVKTATKSTTALNK